MPTAKKKALAPKASPNTLLKKTTKINVFQITILVLLFVVAGVVYKVYSHGSAVNPYASACPVPHPTIKAGTSNSDCTKYLQWSLNQLGNKLTVSGTFGADTTQVVKNFQVNRHLSPVDGIVGNVTWGRLDQEVPPSVGGFNYALISGDANDGSSISACWYGSEVYYRVVSHKVTHTFETYMGGYTDIRGTVAAGTFKYYHQTRTSSGVVAKLSESNGWQSDHQMEFRDMSRCY